LILLDTNVLSLLARRGGWPVAEAWIAQQDSDDLFVSGVSAFEMLKGVENLSPGRKRDILHEAVQSLLYDVFIDRILPFGLAEASAAADFQSQRSAIGRPVQSLDILIAGTALAHNMTLATRNIKDFDGAGLKLLNPWNPTP
jgi:toxin FitB